MKRASYRAGVAWIALNDEPDDHDADSIKGYISTQLLADLFWKDSADVARDILKVRIADSDHVPDGAHSCSHPDCAGYHGDGSEYGRDDQAGHTADCDRKENQ